MRLKSNDKKNKREIHWNWILCLDYVKLCWSKQRCVSCSPDVKAHWLLIKETVVSCPLTEVSLSKTLEPKLPLLCTQTYTMSSECNVKWLCSFQNPMTWGLCVQFCWAKCEEQQQKLAEYVTSEWENYDKQEQKRRLTSRIVARKPKAAFVLLLIWNSKAFLFASSSLHLSTEAFGHTVQSLLSRQPCE